MKKRILEFVSVFFLFAFGYSQVKENEIISKNSRGKAELINFSETKINSDDKSVDGFLKKQFKTKSEVEFKKDKNKSLIENNLNSEKFQQYYKGIKVEFGVQNIVSENGNLKTANGRFVEIQNINTIPKLSENQALQFALKNINAKEYKWEKKENEEFIKKEQNDKEATFFPKGEIVIIEKKLFGNTPIPRLAYKFDIYASNPLSRDLIYVDAENGEILLKDPVIKHILGIGDKRYSGQRNFETQQVSTNQFKLRDYSRGSGIETLNLNRGTDYSTATDFIDNDNNWSSTEYNNVNKDNAALDAHWGAGKTYDYFLQKHGRNSYNGTGGVIKSYVHYSNAYDNAFWDGQRMTYGDGGSYFTPLTSIDVVGHEIGHGVCSSTANLVYANESGAINESLSDIWGAMIEYFAEPTKQTYLIGEEIKIGGGALRSMINPKSFNHPNTYGGQFWYTGTGDNGGVHTNSGVFNHWFYILAEGKNGTNDLGNAYNIIGIGKEKAAKIVYRAESVYFTSTTNYLQARDLTIQSAKDLYGANSVEAVTVCQSWYSVGVGSNDCVLPLEINGNNVICNSTVNYTYTITNLPPNSTVVWSYSTNALILVSSTNTSITVKPVNSTYNGIAKVTATIAGKVTDKFIWIGKPRIDLQMVSNSNYVDLYLIGANSSDINKQGITSTTWVKTASTNSGNAGGSGFEGFGHGPNYNWTATLQITATNLCGSSTITKIVTCAPPSSNCNSITYELVPTSNNQFSIYEIVLPCVGIIGTETTQLYNKPIEAHVFNYQGHEVLKTNFNSINLSGFKSGIYIIKAIVNNKEISKKIIIK